MRNFTLLMLALFMGIAANAQTVATFDTLTLPKQDTFYVNYSSYGNDVGFDDGLAHFPCVYDTSFGYEFWSYGFAYSNMNDGTTPGFMNQYAAVAGKGYNNTNQYVVAYGSYNNVYLKGKAQGQPVNGFYVTNSTYAYHSMKDGDAFAKKFTNADKDWYKITIRGYKNGNITPDSVEVFLADCTHTDSTKDTILKGWQWVNLLPLKEVDSLEFALSSSDNGAFGMNTPAYFCMDNFGTFETSSVKDAAENFVAKVYPNPAVNELYVELKDRTVREMYITDMTGKVLSRIAVKDAVTLIPMNTLVAGNYILNMVGEGKTAGVRFVKH